VTVLPAHSLLTPLPWVLLLTTRLLRLLVTASQQQLLVTASQQLLLRLLATASQQLLLRLRLPLLLDLQRRPWQLTPSVSAAGRHLLPLSSSLSALPHGQKTASAAGVQQ